jgi:hypothetical protein
MARVELHRLLEDRALERTPILVCANKVDLQPHISEKEVKGNMQLHISKKEEHSAVEYLFLISPRKNCCSFESSPPSFFHFQGTWLSVRLTLVCAPRPIVVVPRSVDTGA